MKYFAIVNDETNKGYTASVKSLMGEIKSDNIFDLSSVNQETLIEEIVKSAQKEKIVLVGAADLALKTFNSIMNNEKVKSVKNNIDLVILSDRYYNLDISNIKKATLIMPEDVINTYKKNSPDAEFTSYPADLVASPSKQEMQERSQDFQNLNLVVAQKIDYMFAHGAVPFFVGGRVALPDGSFKENTAEIFAKAAKTFVENNKKGVIVFHGLRSFTKGDKSNDFEPVQAFYDTIKKYIKDGQEFVLLTKKLNPDNKRTSLYKGISKKDNKMKQTDFDLRESQLPAVDYYFMLDTAIKHKSSELMATIEQMNFIPEALELGASPRDLKPYKWDLSISFNINAYDKLFEAFNKENKILQTQKQAFLKLVKEKYKNSLQSEELNSILGNLHQR